MQGSPYQYPPQQQQPQQPYYPQQQMQPYPAQGVVKRRNVGLIIAGCALLGIAGLAFLVFAYNAYQYSTVEEHFSDIKGSEWVVDLIKEADLKRMIIFGSVSALFGIPGLILGLLGLRKR